MTPGSGCHYWSRLFLKQLRSVADMVLLLGGVQVPAISTLPEELSLVDSAPHDPTDMTFTVGQGLLDLRTSPHSPQPYPLSFEESCSAHARQALW